MNLYPSSLHQSVVTPKHRGGDSPTMAETRANGMHSIRKSYVDLKLSSNVLSRSYHEFLVKRYSETILTTYKQWFYYFTRHNIDPFDSSLNQSAEFLAEYFHEGVSYSMNNTVRSALSSVFQAKNDTPFGKHPFIVRLLKGISKQKNVHFKWIKIPNYDLTKYQLYAFRLKPLHPLHSISFKNKKAWFLQVSFGIQEIHWPIFMCYYIC